MPLFPWMVSSSLQAYDIDYAALPDGSTGYLSDTTTTSATHSGSIWEQKTKNGVVQPILGGHIYWNASDQLVINGLTSTAVYRDPAAFYCIEWNASGAEVNGDAVTGTGTYATSSISNLRLAYDGTNYANNPLAAFVFFDGSDETLPIANSTDATTGNTVAKAPSGSPHTYLKFGNNANLGENSGTGSDWTVNGTVTQITSTPTNVFWSFNVLHDDRNGTVSNGNRTVSGTVHQVGTLMVDSGSYAWKVTDAGSGGDYGIETTDGATETVYTASASDVLEFELDLDVGTLDVRVNGGSATSVATGLSGSYVPLCKAPCTITPDFTPADNSFKTLCTNNLPKVTDSIDNHFVVDLDTGANIETTAKANFTDYLTWIKDRDNSNNHQVMDTVRGSTAVLQTNTTAAETTYVAPTGNSVAWTFNLPSSETNTSGTISVDWKYNATLGKAVGIYTGNGVAGATLGLPTINGKAPAAFGVKRRDTTGNWPTYHASLGATKYLYINTTAAAATSSTFWNDTEPTASVLTLGSSAEVNASGGTYVIIAYWNTPFCRVGSYTTNSNADGPFINEMLSMEWGLFKEDGSTNWIMPSRALSEGNPMHQLLPDQPDPENTAERMDGTAVGAKMRTANSPNFTSTCYYIMIGQPMGPVENTAR